MVLLVILVVLIALAQGTRGTRAHRGGEHRVLCGCAWARSARIQRHLRLPWRRPRDDSAVVRVLGGLGVDYSIFLMSRAREESLKHGTRRGRSASPCGHGGVITSAGIVLAAHLRRAWRDPADLPCADRIHRRDGRTHRHNHRPNTANTRADDRCRPPRLGSVAHAGIEASGSHQRTVENRAVLARAGHPVRMATPHLERELGTGSDLLTSAQARAAALARAAATGHGVCVPSRVWRRPDAVVAFAVPVIPGVSLSELGSYRPLSVGECVTIGVGVASALAAMHAPAARARRRVACECHASTAAR